MGYSLPLIEVSYLKEAMKDIIVGGFKAGDNGL